MVKRSMVGIFLLVIVFLVAGCLDYKAYDLPQDKPSSTEESGLVDEIAAIEAELGQQEEELEPDAEPQNDGLAEENTEVGSETGITGAAVGSEAGTDTAELDTEVETEVLEEEKEEGVIIPELGREPQESLEYQVITVKENQSINLKVNITDPDNDPVTYTFSPPLDKNGAWKTNYGDAGEYIVTITAKDRASSTEKKVKIVVARVNVPPTIAGIKDLEVDEGEVVKFAPTVSDPNKDPVTVSISGPLKEGTFVTDHTSAGDYQIKVTASDGELETSRTFQLKVNNVNVKPELENVPAQVKIKEGEIVRIEPKSSDLDGDKVTVTISEPIGDDGVWETGYTNHGTYKVVVTADDGKEKVSRNVDVFVEDVNMPPQINEVYVLAE